jgi:hypothetical protein
MKIEKIKRPAGSIYRVTSSNYRGAWAYSRTMALVWFFTARAHNASVRRYNNRNLKPSCIADRPKTQIPAPLVLVWVVWFAISALILWWAFNL